ncbi:hypothetical protein AB833_04825 [Chromatiales bacterium (ex Bugula neritina AB1)]|nr:hypothetical protein AB833_04825 [Chromatiales bacterium (ex Bugula neritina AB1)]
MLLLLLLCVTTPVSAHFKLNLNIRIMHIEHVDNGVDVFLRLPMPYLVADRVGAGQTDGSRLPAPFTSNKIVDGELMHYVDFSALTTDPLGLGEIARQGHTIETSGQQLKAEVKAVSLFTGLSQPPFSTLEEAKRAFAKHTTQRIEPAPFVGDVVVDVLLQYRGVDAVSNYQISSDLNPRLPGQDDTANLIVDYAEIPPKIFRIKGLIDQPVEISNSSWAAASTFVVEGVHHILSGYDHLLFVVCLVLGAAALPVLIWRVSGFTIGHMLTLTLGFFGYAPDFPWFVPLVETGIAISIVIAAVYAIGSTTAHGKGVVITVLIGMLHGLGFSFVLREILGVSSPNLWVSLLSFNVGVELGQLAVVVMLWPLLYLIGRNFPAVVVPVKWVIALPCIGIAAFWSGQRGLEFLTALLG